MVNTLFLVKSLSVSFAFSITLASLLLLTGCGFTDDVVSGRECREYGDYAQNRDGVEYRCVYSENEMLVWRQSKEISSEMQAEADANNALAALTTSYYNALDQYYACKGKIESSRSNLDYAAWLGYLNTSCGLEPRKPFGVQ